MLSQRFPYFPSAVAAPRNSPEFPCRFSAGDTKTKGDPERAWKKENPAETRCAFSCDAKKVELNRRGMAEKARLRFSGEPFARENRTDGGFSIIFSRLLCFHFRW